MRNQKQVLISSHLFDELKAYLAKQKSHYPMRRFVDEAIEMKLKMDAQNRHSNNESDPHL